MRTIEHDDYLADDYSPTYSTKKRKPGKLWGLLKYPIYAAVGACAIFLLFRSHGLYQTAFEHWGLPFIGSKCSSFQPIPLLGGLVNGGCVNVAKLVIGLMAFLALVALTILMSIPVLLYFDPEAIEGFVSQMRHNKRTHQALTTEAGDTSEIRSLIDRHKTIHESDLRTLVILSVIAFVAEAVIVWTARGSHANVWTVLIDSIGFDVLLSVFFVFRNTFRAKPKKTAIDVD